MIVLWRIEIGGIIRGECLKRRKIKGVKPVGGFTPLCFWKARIDELRSTPEVVTIADSLIR